MRFTILFTSLSLLALATPLLAQTPSPPNAIPEFVTLGCPSTTKPIATAHEQQSTWDTFIDLLYNQVAVEEAFTTYVAEGYINHAAHVARNGRNESVAGLLKSTPFIRTELHHVYVGWDVDGAAFGTVHLRALHEDTGEEFAVVDMIRMVGTCLVEHWGVQQEIRESENPVAYF